MIISDDDAQAAWDFVRGDGRKRLQHWVTEECRLDHRRHVVLAILTDTAPGSSHKAKEDWARRQPEYEEHIEALAIARGSLAAARSAITDARNALDLWRTEQSNQRAAGKVA